jgi:hypothetical protein
MSGRGGDARRNAVKSAAESRLLAILLSLAALNGMSDALGAPVSPLSQTPASPMRAATPPALERPAGETIPDTPAGSQRNPNPVPMPAPAVTDNYAGSGPFVDILKTGPSQQCGNEGGLIAVPVV